MKIYKYIIIFLVAFSAIGFALGSGVALVAPQPPKTGSKSVAEQEKEGMFDKKNPFVDLTADVTEQRAAKDSTIYLVGNVAFHHNGAIIQCDSAARYTNSEKMDFFGRVIISKDSAYIYGDKVSYDAATDMAVVYSPLVKMTRGDVVLYSYNLQFNTKTNIAYFENGGVMNKGVDNFMESFKGEFDVDRNVVKFVDSVSMRSKDYDIKTDSLTYGLDDEIVTFLTHTFIWSKDSSIMVANKGFYYTKSSTYEFFEDAYIVSKDQEMWADTMNYYSPMRQATMMRNVQILDTANRTIAFGDWAFYDDSLGVAILTKLPSVRSYNSDNSDTTYMRSDTIFMTTYEVKKPILPKDSLAVDSLLRDSLAIDSLGVDSLNVGDSLVADSLSVVDSVARANSVALRDSVLKAHPSAKETFEMLSKIRRKKLDRFMVKDSLVVDSLLTDSVKIAIDSLPLKDSIGVAIDSAQPKDSLNSVDSLVKKRLAKDSLNVVDTLSAVDSLTLSDSTMLGKLKLDSLKNDTLYTVTKEKIIRAYYNVRMWSKENQAICDSVIAFSVDSSAQMHGSPIIWNENNQITAEEIIAHSANDQIDWVEFFGDPFITQKVEPKYVEPQDSSRFNQAKGKEMFVYFKDNEIDSLILSGNVINNYYMESDGYTSAFATINCAELVVFFSERKTTKMRWEGKSEWDIYPIEKIDPEVTEKLEGFSWQQDKRPKSAIEISNRVLKPSMRASVSGESMPNWTIEQRINEYKKSIIENQSWTDRTDINTITVEYFETQNQQL